MTTRAETADFLVDQMARAGRVSARKMFDEYCVYCDGKVVALICNDQLFVRPTAAGRALIGKPCEAPPYPRAKPHFLIGGDLCEDADWLANLVRATAKEPSAPKPKAKPEPKAKKRKAEEKTKRK